MHNPWRIAGFSLVLLILCYTLSPAQKRVSSNTNAATHQDIKRNLGFVPQFLMDLPEVALPGTWLEIKTLQMNPGTRLSRKAKELIGLAVAAQVPCSYCIDVHKGFAEVNGAGKGEIGEAIAIAGITRHWSTVLNGMDMPMADFREEFKKIAKTLMAKKKSIQGPRKPINVVGTKSAMMDIKATLGMIPKFLDYFPKASLAGAWKTLKDVQINPNTDIDSKTKSLIALGVAAQIPCEYCVVANNEFAKINGATAEEIKEAIAMAALTRHMSTLLNGVKTNRKLFKKELATILESAKTIAPKDTAAHVQKAGPGKSSATGTPARKKKTTRPPPRGNPKPRKYPVPH